VPSFKSVKSSVVPDGTATSDNTIVEQDVLEALAEDAPSEPEKVQLEARSCSAFRVGGVVGAGAGTACTTAERLKERATRDMADEKECIL
jgi:hypothetical protein